MQINDAPKGLFRRILRNGSLVFSGKALAGLLGLGYLALAGHALGPADLGVLIILHSLTITFRELLSFKSWQALIRYGAHYVEQANKTPFERILRLCIALDAAGAVLAAAVSAACVYWLGSSLGLPDDLKLLSSIYCISTLLAFKSTPVGVIRLFGRFDLLARQVLVVPVVRLIGVVLCWFFALPLSAYVTVWFVADVATSIVLIVMGKQVLRAQKLGATVRLTPTLRGYASHDGISSFLINSNLHSTVGTATTHAPILLTGAILGPAAAALVKIAQELAAGLAKPGQLLGEAAYPELARLVAKDQTEAVSTLKKKALISGGLTSVVLVTLIVFIGEPLLVTLFGDGYRSASVLLAWLALAGGIQLTVFLLEPLLFASGLPGRVLLVRAGTAGVQLGWIALCLQRDGITAVGQAAVIGTALTAFLFLALEKFLSARPINRPPNV